MAGYENVIRDDDMIYYCEICRFIFERTGEVDACPDCGKPSVREATSKEKNGYLNNRTVGDNDDGK